MISEKDTVSYKMGFLRESAGNLAELHSGSKPGTDIRPVKPILDESKEILTNAYRVLSGLAKSDQELSPAAEWLIDNFYIIQEQIVQVEVDFPRAFQISIPLLTEGEYKGLPRVYELMLNYLVHTDNQVNNDDLVQYIQSYQQTETLMQGEVWAIPIMIRLILIQKLAEKASRILDRKYVQIEVNKLLQRSEVNDQQEPGSTVNLISGWMKKTYPDNNSALPLIELYNQLQSSGRLSDEEKRWFNYKFRQLDTLLEEAQRIEAQKQSRLQVSIQNAVISLRHTSETDWIDFVEECLVTEKILKLDPSGHYPDMDFQTRDSYRRTVERLSRNSEYSETEVVEQVLLLVEDAMQHNSGQADRLHNKEWPKQHVGYYLIGDGYNELTRIIGYSEGIKEKIRNRLKKQSAWYISGIILHTVILMVILWMATDSMSESAWISATVLLVSLFPALDLSISAVNRFLAFFLPPRILPKMDYKKGIPDEARTLVVVPTMFSSPEDARKQIEKLEIRSLANPDKSLQFALLSDFLDAKSKHCEYDNAILETAINGISELNKKYQSRYGDKFFMLHRERQWNPSEKVWMGWERKRGKLEEFNKLLIKSESETSYKHIEGDFFETLKKGTVHYVITLDSDTKLPPDSARDLIRTIAHPLNCAWYNPEKKRITRGYGFIQPRISIPPESARKTWFSRIFSGNVGLDPYSTAVSNIYQDLAGEGVFTGKGIYNVQAFYEVLHNKFPENRILSHDLLESTYLRAGLATDIELFDDYPSTYASFSKRNHRWTRGDWQIAAWLFPKVPSVNGKEPNPINLLSRWKIFDNLRRSLNPFFLTIFFIAGWFLLPGSAWIWTAAAFGILAFPIYINLSGDLLNRPARVRWKLYMEVVRANLKINSVQSLFMVIILPHQAVGQLDAIFRTLYRLFYSNKLLLEWQTASHAESSAPNTFYSYLRSKIFSLQIGILILIAAIYLAPYYLWIIIPFFFLWTGAPLYVWYVSQPLKSPDKPFDKANEKKLRLYARRTWFYFERFVNEDHFWLPPDNYQEDPSIPLAERTSPTNIGLALVSTQVAYNMGYITLSELLERLENTLNSMDKLERFNGHFYNWYETRLGQVLSPKYISTVDSGNLAAGLIVIKESVKKVMNTPGINNNLWQGLDDTITSVREIFEEYNEDSSFPDACYQRIDQFTSKMLNDLENHTPGEPENDLAMLKNLKDYASSLCSIDLMPLGSRLDDNTMQDLLFWMDSPLKLIERGIYYLKTLSLPVDYDLNQYSPVELNSLLENEEGIKNQHAQKLLRYWSRQAEQIESVCEKFITEMDFSFLYLEKRHLFSFGYNVEKAKLDSGTYDLLASEARIASYIAIAKGDIPVQHWFSLSRRLTNLSQNEILLSWGGTMFEYLMPLLFMRSYPDTLLNHTGDNVVDWQIEYGKKRNLPWGYSESAYGFLNIDLHYQYKAFGAPGLGLKRGLAEEYVVAPYASLLSLMVNPKKSFKNLKRLEDMGGFGLHGFYDAVDFTPSRLNGKKEYQVVKTYMVHHHGMGLIAIENVLNNWSVHNYFHSDPRMKGCELILQERVPRGVPIKEPHPIDAELEPGEKPAVQTVVEHAGILELDNSPPRLHILSNGTYSLFLTHAGTGMSKNNGIAMNGWEPDPTCDPLGMFFYVRDAESGKFWSSMHQPVRRKPDRYDTWFHDGKIVTSRVDEWIETTTEVSVSPDHPIEFRKITLTNYSQEQRKLELTSYAEVVLNRVQDHRSHPAFSKLFIQTDYLPEHHSILAKRRPRSDEESEKWLVHTFAGKDPDNVTEPLQFETERGKFIGRGRSLGAPAAMDEGNRLTGSLGNVSDPIVSLRKNVILNPGEKVEFTFGIGFASTREEAVRLADTYDNPHATNRAFDLASVYSSVELNHIGVTSKQAHYYQKMASLLLYPNNLYRAREKNIRENRKLQHNLWAFGISGDLPLIVFRINNVEQLKDVKKLLNANAFWQMKGLETELLFINDHDPGYVDEVHDAIMQAIETSSSRDRMNKPGGVYLHRSDMMAPEDLTLILAVAHAVFEYKLPKLSNLKYQMGEPSWSNDSTGELFKPAALDNHEIENEEKNLQFFNGIGGFSESGDEYQITVKPDPKSGTVTLPPAPWINVIANPEFGFLATEKGGGYTWSKNSRENKLTEWANDPVLDVHSEAFYIRDENRNTYWSPTPGPVAGNGIYTVAHGFGYTRYEHESEELTQKLVQFVPVDDPVKISTITIQNRSSEKRELSVFRYVDRVLGVSRHTSSRFILQDASDNGKVVFAQNHYNNEFAGRTAYSTAVNLEESFELSFSTDRREFIGRNRSLSNPASLTIPGDLDNKISIGGDSCTVLCVRFHVEPGEEISFSFLEGECKTRNEAEQLIEKYNEEGAAANALIESTEGWHKKLNGIRVETPDQSLNLMVNGWLMYQNLCCRMWGRTAFYQSGGAYGFRDQLQDSMAAFYMDASITRKQILIHSEKQFPEGDVLHWWHPPTGRGIRSKISDDRLWLPYVTAFYIRSTGDETILDEETPFIQARTLEEHEHEVYLSPEIMDMKGSVYDHCCRAIDISLKFGEHGLPLMGAGDWNDGMNRVGEHGKGESVWLGFFIYSILVQFEQICRKKDDGERADRYIKTADELKKRLNNDGWDGNWYLRAFYDDGTPLGSSENKECRIDGISQAWSVISGASEKEKGVRALLEAESHLISRHDGIIRLLTPPFDRTDKNPGYIKGYIPGVRENGGQYTHGALWVIKAMAELGWGNKAVSYLNMINPVNRALNAEAVQKYKVEPYVVAADVYGEPPLNGMGGWTWYTGSGGWMYRVALESVLGFQLVKNHIILKPSVSSDWPGYKIAFRADDGETYYHIEVKNPDKIESGVLCGNVDGKDRKFKSGTAKIRIEKDRKVHKVVLILKSSD